MNGSQEKSCEAWAEPISMSAAGCLTSDERRDLDRHLDACPSCRERFERLAVVCRALDASRLSGEEAGAAVVGCVMAAIEGQRTTLGHRPTVGRVFQLVTGIWTSWKTRPTEARPQAIPLTRRVFTVKNLTISAGVLSAAVVLVVALTPSTPTFANVMEKIQKAHTLSASFVMTGKCTIEGKETKVPGIKGTENVKMTVEGRALVVPDTKGTMYLRDDGSTRVHIRMDFDFAGVSKKEVDCAAAAGPVLDLNEVVIVDNASTKKSIMIFPKSKQFLGSSMCVGMTAHEKAQHIREFIEAFQRLRQDRKPEKELGEKTLNGKTVKGFLVSDPEGTRIWIDKVTGNPEVIEIESKAFSAKVTYSDIRINPAIDDSMFSTDKPDGYTMPPTMDIEKCIAEELTEYTSTHGGKFPDEYEFGIKRTIERTSATGGEDPSLVPPIGFIVVESSTVKVEVGEPVKEVKQLGPQIRDFAELPSGMVDLVDESYLGKGKKVGRKDEIIYWYKKSDGRHRALYGDLVFKDIKPEDLAKKK
jgi:hypothetical protein